MRVTRRYKFSASHRLHSDQLNEAENQAVFGKCNNPYGHGHDYVLEVCVRGPVYPDTGQAVDVRQLDGLVQSEILAAYDHKNMNTDLPEYASLVPTTENVAVQIHRRLAEQWTRAFPQGQPALDRVRLYETKRNIFELTSYEDQ